ATVPVGSNPVGVAIMPADNDSGLAQLIGDNTFTGNQTVSGSVTATTFVGNGAGLTGVAATTANTANFATSAGTAMNALSLGGVSPGNYARRDVANNLIGDQAITGNMSASGSLAVTGSVTIAGGTAITKHLAMNIH